MNSEVNHAKAVSLVLSVAMAIVLYPLHLAPGQYLHLLMPLKVAGESLSNSM
jgi:hypothetical protein